MATDKRIRYRAKMGAAGLVQANEWVPRDQRPLFKAVAQALRDGVPVTIGEVPRDPAPEVPRDPGPEVPRDLAPEVPKDPEIAAKPGRKNDHHARQARYAAAWAAATERLRVVDPNGKGHEARVTRREMRTLQHRVFGTEMSYQHVEGLILNGKTFQTMAYRLWPHDDFRPIRPSGWRFVTDAEIAQLRRQLSDLHPDKGGPGGATFQAAKEALDALLGRA